MTSRYADGRLAQVGDNRLRYDAGGRAHVVEGSAKGETFDLEMLRALDRTRKGTEEQKGE